MKPFKKIAVLFFSFFLITSTSFAQENNGPTLWSLSDDDTTIYIFGTIHILNKDVNWYTPKIREAFEGSDALVLELGPDQEDPALIQPLIIKYGLLQGGETLKTLLSEKDYSNLTDALNGIGVPGNALDTMQPWLAATVLTLQIASNHGFLPEHGVEQVLTRNANQRDLPIFGLETAEFQLSALASLSPESQKLYLGSTIEELDGIEEVFIEMRDSWVTGDLEALDTLINSDIDLIPGLAETILYQRNQNWVGDVADLLEVPGQYFVAVGTGHLIGDKNLIALLREVGYQVSEE